MVTARELVGKFETYIFGRVFYLDHSVWRFTKNCCAVGEYHKKGRSVPAENLVILCQPLCSITQGNSKTHENMYGGVFSWLSDLSFSNKAKCKFGGPPKWHERSLLFWDVLNNPE